MATSAIQNPEVRSESKSAKKKKAKVDAATVASAAPVEASITTDSNNGDGSYESPYIKELYKSIRNVNKKIANASKVDNVLEQNPGKTLDELVATRKINADQKAQILKKPSLRASLAQLEEQIAQYKKFDQEYKARAQAEKSAIEKELTDKSGKELVEAVAAAKAEAAAAATQEKQQNLLLLSKFLRLAAARRAADVDQTLDENQALEGALVEVYTGDETAVVAMEKLIKGSDEQALSINGEKVNTTYAQIKQAAIEFLAAPTDYELEQPAEDNTSAAQYPVGTDPTIANAGLTELDAVATADLTNGDSKPVSPAEFPTNSGFGDGANAAAEANWDNQNNTTNDLSASSEWVDVRLPREAGETETGIDATLAAQPNTQSWADEQPEAPAAAAAPPAPAGDGFHEVQRNRGNRDGQGRGGRGMRGGEGHRGRGGYRGRGNGEGGRGRGAPRFGGNRGPRPQETS